jgi:FkbM family methyltransferase
MDTLAEIIQIKNLITDKNSLHSYCDEFYEKELAKYRNKQITITEIGIDQGGSLILWAEYFQNAKIMGIDLQLRGSCQSDCSKYQNITLAVGNAYSYDAIKVIPKSDIIIDDGSHELDHQIWVVKNLAMKLNPGGLLVIEDVVEYEYLEKLKAATPLHLKPYVEFVDLRSIKNRSDDLLFVIRVPNSNNINLTDTAAATTSPGMDMMLERLSHLKNQIDFSSIKNIVDVGSAHGYESLNLATLFPSANLWGFEPVAEHFQHCLKIKQQAEAAISNRLHFFNLALDSQDGDIPFYPLDPVLSRGNNTGMASKYKIMDPRVFPHELNVQTEITVPAQRLDTWCSRNGIVPQIIWMDAQGSELDILRGAVNCLNTVQVILTEAATKPYYHGHNMKSDIDQFLKEQGFEELLSARKLGHEYEMDTIYLRKYNLN